MGVEPPTNIKKTARRRRESTPADIRQRMMVYVSCTHCHHEVTINSFSAFQGAALLMAVKHARSIVDVTKAIEAKQPRQSSNAANPFLRNPIDRVPAFHETIRDATAVRQTVTFAGEDSA